MNEVVQKINIKEVVDVRDALKGISSIKDALSKLAISPETKASFDGYFQKIERNAEKASTAMASGFKKKRDVEDYNDAMKAVVGAYDEIIRKLDLLKNKNTPLKESANDFKQAGEQIKNLGRQLEKLKAGFSEIQQKASKGILAATSDHSLSGDQCKKIRDNFNDTKVDIEKVNEALVALKKRYAEAKTNKWTEGNRAAEWEQYAQDIRAVEDNLKKYNEALSNQTTIEDSLRTAQTQYNEILAKSTEELNKASVAADSDAQSIRKIAQEQGKAAKESQQLNSELEHFKSKAAYFFGIANGINLLKRAIRSAYDTVKDLDAVMTETAVVTNFDVGDMWAQLPEYTQRANELGVSIHSAYEAATIFYQQGLKTNEVMAVSNETLKMARIAGLDAATASDRMTNALRGFNMEMDKVSAQRVNDVYSKLAAITASNTDEISTAMTKVASLAHNANMEFETTSAFLAQIIESTRESAETAGTALKTVVARFSEVKKLYSKGQLLGNDEEGEEIDVNKVSTALRSAGINLNEYLTGSKGLDDIFIELAEKWDSLDKVQQRYIATMAAGSRQQSRFIALMSDYKRTVELVDAANNANGASQEQYGKTLDSLETKLSRLKNAWNEFVLGLANSEAIKGAVDLLTSLITAINKLISTISGKNSAAKMITTFITAFTAFKVGQKVIGKNNALTTFFGRLVGNSDVIVKGSAGQIASAFYANLATKISDFEKGGNLKGALSRFFNKKANSINSYFAAPMTPALRQNLFQDVLSSQGISGLNPEQSKALQEVLKNDTVTATEFNQVMEQQKIQFRLTEENAEKYNFTMQKGEGIVGDSAATMRIFATAALAVGGALMAVGSQLEKTDRFKGLGTALKTAGTALMTFGTIMSVYLPLQAQLMANKVTGAIVSIPIVGWIAAVVSALVALGVALYNFSKNNSLEARLEKSQEAAKNAAQAADDAKEAYEKLGETWKQLDEKNEALENATKGTREWRDALKEANDVVLQLMNSYGGMVEITRGENGALTISNRKELDDRMAKIAATSEGTARVSRITELENEERKRLADFFESHYKVSHNDDGTKNADFLPTAKLLQGDLDELSSKSDTEIKKSLVELYEKQGIRDYDLDKDVAEIRNFINEGENSKRRIEAETTALGSTFLRNANIDKELQPYANSLMTTDYVNAVKNSSLKNYEKDNTDKLRKKYAEAHGQTWATMVKDNPELKELSDQELREYLATNDALEQVNNQLNAFAKNIGELNGSDKALFADMNGGGLTQSDITNLTPLLGNEDALKKQYEKYGGNKAYGENGFEIFKKQLEDSLNQATENFKLDKFSDTFTNQLNTELLKGLTSGTFKGFVDNLSSVYVTSGEQGMKVVQQTISQMAKKVKPAQLESFYRTLNSIDWTNADQVQNLKELTKQYGISDAEIDGLTKQLIAFNNAANKIDLEKLSDIIGLLQKITSGEQGRSFTAEQYEQLVNNGANPEKFAYNAATNTYDYTGADVREIAATVFKKTDDAINQLVKEDKSNKAAEKAVGTYGANLTDPGQMRRFLYDYIKSAGENSLVDMGVVISKSDNEVRQAYEQVMGAYNKRDDTEAELGQAKALRYQTYTGSELVGEIKGTGSEDAMEALASKLIASGLPTELVNKLMPYVMGKGQGEGKVNTLTSEAGELVDITNEATSYGISIEDLNTYASALRSVEGLEKARESDLYRLALANAKYQTGIKNLADSYDDWVKLKKEDGTLGPKDGNLEQLKTFEKMKRDLKEMFNLSEDIPDSFFESAENVKLMEKAVKGDTKAVVQLRNILSKSGIDNLSISDDAKNKIKSQIDLLTKEAPNLKFGATLDDSEYGKKLKEMMEESGMTVKEMEKVFKSLGWSPEISYDTVDVATAAKMSSDGYQEIADPAHPGETIRVPVTSLSDYASDGKVRIPKIGNATYTKPTPPPLKTKPKKKGNGGGSKKKAAKKTYWENPYDELYNLQQKINEALRTRESLERRYQKLLKQEQATLEDIRKSYYAQITNLRSEANLQKQFAEGRLRQINQLGNKIYTDENGKRKTFKSLGVTKYASYNTDTGLLTIDWEGLEAISKNSKRTNEGKAAEAYISKLEELVGSYEEVRDKLWSIEDEIENLRQTAIESYLSFEDRVMESLITKYQQQIDSYQAMSDALDKANNEVISSLREQVDLSRQIRDNTEKENEISDMENRLAYLQRDTSGANALEVQKLQKDLEDAREGYTDTLIDQAIDKIQKDADVAAEQRARQIETMTEQLEIMKNTGALWQQVYDLIDEAGDGNGALSSQSNLVELLKKSEAFASLSNIGQEKWWSEVAEQFHAAWVGRGESEDKYKRDANNDGIVNNTDTQDTIDSVAQTATTVQPTAATTVNHTDKDKYGVALAVSEGSYGWGVGETRTKNLKAKGFNPDEIQAIINKVANDVMAGTWSGKYYGIKDLNPYKLSKFKQGGLADFTGPAWLDGTKTRPELILNAQDSRNFITLKDILASLMSSSGANGGIINEAKQVNVDIQATIQGDYDVDRMVERVKKDIYDDGQYRNVNSISFLR